MKKHPVGKNFWWGTAVAVVVSHIKGVQWKPSPHSWQVVNAKETGRGEGGDGELFIQWAHIKDQHVKHIHIYERNVQLLLKETIKEIRASLICCC